MTECVLCKAVEVSESPPLCDYCKPNSCVSCHVEEVNYLENEFKCSHGCTYSVFEYVEKRMYTELLNGSWKDKLALAGERVEYIIPNIASITIYETPPDETAPNCVLGTHYTDNTELLRTKQYDSTGYDGAERFDGTIRENAAYAWPYPPSYTEKHFEWNTEYVVFEVPKSEVYVSSYRFIDWVSDSGAKHAIPVSKYESELTFSPDQLYEVCRERNRPTKVQNLF